MLKHKDIEKKEMVDMAVETLFILEVIVIFAKRWNNPDGDLKMVEDLKVEGNGQKEKGFWIIVNG